MMYRFYSILAILIAVSSLGTARTVHVPSRDSSSHSKEEGECRNTTDIDNHGSAESDFPQVENATTSAINGSEIEHTSTTMPNAIENASFRKGRDTNDIVELAKSSSSSKEIEGSGEYDSTSPAFNMTHSEEDLLNASNTNAVFSGSTTSSTVGDMESKELGSGAEESAPILSNDVIDPKVAMTEEIAALKKKVQQWQGAVESYFQNGRRRRKRATQSGWSQFFSSSAAAPSSNSVFQPNNIKDTADSFITAAGSAVGDALKPAMDLMAQGVNLLGDLYSSHLSKPVTDPKTRALTLDNTNTSVVVDQFRDQLKQLQTKLGDLGEQLQRVVSSFHDMQVPFFDNIIAGGRITSNGIASSANTGRQNNAFYVPKKDKEV